MGMGTALVGGAAASLSHARPRADALVTLAKLDHEVSAHAVSMFRPLDLWHARLPKPDLIALSQPEIDRVVADTRTLFSWVDDGNCYARGFLGAARIEDLLSGRIGGPGDAVRAAVALVPTRRHETGWTFHAASVIRSAADGELYVIDHLLAPETGLMKARDWAVKATRHPDGADQLTVQHLLDNVPALGPITTPETPFIVHGLAGTVEGSVRRAIAGTRGATQAAVSATTSSAGV